MNDKPAEKSRAEHPLHFLLSSDLERGKERLWAALEVSDYVLVGAARMLGTEPLSLNRWLREFHLLKEFGERKTIHSARVLDARIEESRDARLDENARTEENKSK